MATANESARTKKVVVYTGLSTTRDIDEKSWKQVGVNDQKAILWDKATGHEVPADQLNADAIRYLTERDGEFEVREVPAD
jgi:hypothetical protein